MADPTLAELENIQEQLVEVLQTVKFLLESGDRIDVRLFNEFMQQFNAAGDELDEATARNIRRELKRRRRAQERILPLVMSAVDVEEAIQKLKDEIQGEENEEKKKLLHKRKIKRLLLLILANIFVLSFVKKSIDEIKRLKLKLSI